MKNIPELLLRDQTVARATFHNVEAGLNQVLPGSDTHNRYRDAEEVGLAVVIDRTDRETYNPVQNPRVSPMFKADNEYLRPNAWEPIPADSEFLEGHQTRLGRFAFFALAKTENMRVTGGLTSFDPEQLSIEPGRVGFAGGRRLFGAFVTPSGLWELHDHKVAGVIAEEIVAVVADGNTSRSADDFAELFEEEFTRIQRLHEGVDAADLSRSDIGKLLPLVDDLPFAA